MLKSWVTCIVKSDVLLRRLRELGELHREGVLTDEEFTMTKAAVLRGFR